MLCFIFNTLNTSKGMVATTTQHDEHCPLVSHVIFQSVLQKLVSTLGQVQQKACGLGCIIF